MKVNVLLCSPYKGTIGGISRWTNHIIDYYSNNVINSNISLTLFSLSRSKSIHANTKLITRIYYGLIDYLKLFFEFIVFTRKNKFEIIHLVSSGSLGLFKDLLFIFVCKLVKSKVVIHFRFGRIPFLVNNRNWEFKLLCVIFNYVDYIIVIDQKSYDSIVLLGYTNLSYLPNPLSDKIEKIIDFVDIKRDYSTILFAGHVVPTKGIFELITATKNIDNIKVKIAGFCSEEMRFEINKRLDPFQTKYEFLGELGHEETIFEMLKCGIFILPSYTEGFPNVILEAMACGCPIISTNVGAIPEMLDINSERFCGLIVEPKQVKELTEYILELLNNQQLRELIGERSKFKVKYNYTMEIIWKDLEKIWSSLSHGE